ncbi:MAG: aminodeoxychorismate lyase [Oceanospirillum sp.]|nr:aminodeoxychorismate lyase [Oceanospirillum sp.]
MTFLTLIDGLPEQSWPTTDRGLAYGDGVFETCRMLQGQAPLFDLHWQRLSQSIQRLGFELPFTADELKQYLSRAVSGDGLAKLIVTRGSGGRGYCPPEQAHARWSLQGMAVPETPLEYYQQGVQVRSCQLKLSSQPALAGMKHLSCLEQVLARAEWQDNTIFDGLLFDLQDHLIEATVCNVFLLQDHQLITPKLDQSGVSGVMRAAIEQACSAVGLSFVERHIHRSEIAQAEALFLSNSVRGIIPVSCWLEDGQMVARWPVLQPELKPLIAVLHSRLALPVIA